MSDPSVSREAARRRTFAIISHPDAGKTTLTEKFLLYAGAIVKAGSVRARRAQRDARSDWMQMEQERGISISSTVLRFDHEGHVYNLLDTPGHRDFSEDTYRVLSGVDAAIMVLDGAKGVEPQTKKLFEVCRRRKTPLLTFVNKMDRPSMDPLAILDDIETQLDIVPTPVTWPVRADGRFRGVVDRRDRTFHEFESERHGAAKAREQVSDWQPSGPDGQRADEELQLLTEMGADHDRELLWAGELTPVFFGSALSNFGVALLLDAIRDLAPSPGERLTLDGDHRPIDAPFSGFVFKIQANMDPRHRDRLAFVRVCSGRFDRGAQLTCQRTGRRITAKYAHQVFGQDRITVDEAYPGDVIGLVNATDLRIGDTLYAEEPVQFPALPVFTPEHFRTVHPVDRSKAKQFRSGLEQLDEEGVVHILRHPDLGDQAPIMAAVGALQFEVASHRMEHEFNAPIRLESSRFSMARRTDEDYVESLESMAAVEVYRRANGTPMAMFKDKWQLQRIERDHPELVLDEITTS